MEGEFSSTGVRDEFCDDILSWDDKAERLWYIHFLIRLVGWFYVCLMKYYKVTTVLYSLRWFAGVMFKCHVSSVVMLLSRVSSIKILITHHSS